MRYFDKRNNIQSSLQSNLKAAFLNSTRNYENDTHQNLLQGINGLILNRYTVDLSNLITDVKSGLSMDHPTVHNPRHEALPVLIHFQRDSLKSDRKIRNKLRAANVMFRR